MDFSASPENISSYPHTQTSAAFVSKEVPVQQPQTAYPITPLDIAGKIDRAVPASKDAAYTIFMVLNGSDLETQNGFASDDILEILKSRLDSDKINFLILAGGTLEWKNPLMPDREYAVYRVVNGALETLCNLGKQDLSDPALLAGFLDLGYRIYPAKRYGLIFWDHGGGAVIGCGYDEISEKSLLLPEFEMALASSKAAEEPLEFIGFDACMMANLETACICSRYANYLVASEELEPGSGWDYSFLSALSQNPEMTGGEIGRNIGEAYISYFNSLFGRMASVRATISVTDLQRIPAVVQAVEDFAEAANQKLLAGGYNRLAKARGRTMDFAGTGGEDDYDLVDLADLCQQLSEDFPDESAAVVDAVKEAVVFRGNTQNVKNANGLTVYFPFYAKLSSYEYIPIYERINILPHYTELIVNFARILNGDSIAVSSGLDPSAILPKRSSDGVFTFRLSQEEMDSIYTVRLSLWKVMEDIKNGFSYCIQLEESGNVSIDKDGTIHARFDGYQTTLNGRLCCIYEISANDQGERYYIPAVLNDRDVRLIVQCSERYPNGVVIGAALEAGKDSYQLPAPQRELISIQKGDRIRLRYPADLFSLDNGNSTESGSPIAAPSRYEGEEWDVRGDSDLKLGKTPADEGEYLYGFILVDTQLNEFTTDFLWMKLSYDGSGLGIA